MVSHKKQYHTGTRKLNTDKKHKRPSKPGSDTETVSATSSDRSMHDILNNNNNFMGNQMNPMMGNQMNPMMGNQMNPMMGNQMNPMMGNQMNPMMGNQMNQMDPMFDPLSIQTFAPVNNNNTNFNNLALLSNNTRHAEMNLPAMSHPGINHMEMNYAGMNQQGANQPVMNQPGMNNARAPQEAPVNQPGNPEPVNAQSGNTYSLKNLSNLIK